MINLASLLPLPRGDQGSSLAPVADDAASGDINLSSR